MTKIMNGINKFWTIRVAEPGLIFLTFMAGEEGFEPSLTDSESAVLPLDYSPAQQDYSTIARSYVNWKVLVPTT